jgi:hypothetical protein
MSEGAIGFISFKNWTLIREALKSLDGGSTSPSGDDGQPYACLLLSECLSFLQSTKGCESPEHFLDFITELISDELW